MTTFRFLTIFLAGSVFAGVLHAQEAQVEEIPQGSINQDVRVVREYNPTVSDAFKINEMPEQDDAGVPVPEFSYQLSGRALVGAPEVVPLIPAKMAREPRAELMNSFAEGWLGNYNLVGGRLLYNIVQNESYALALRAGHESSLGDIEVDDSDEDADYHHTTAGLYMRHFFKRNKTLRLDMDFSNFAYRYYGSSKLDATTPYVPTYPGSVLPAPGTVYGAELLPDPKQRQTAFDLSLGFGNQILDGKGTRYDLMMGYGTFGNATGVKENAFNYRGDFDFVMGEVGVRLETAMQHASTNVPSGEMPYLYDFAKRQQTLVQVNPAFVKRGKKAGLKMGLRLAAEFDELEDNVYVSPDVSADLLVAEGVLFLEGGITGEIMPSTYRGIMEENPYVSPDLDVKTAFHGVRFFAGVTGNFTQETSFTARVAYNVFHDEHFFVNRSFQPFGSTSGYDRVHNNMFEVLYDDGRMLEVSGEFKLRFSQQMDMLLKGTYYGWDLDSLEHAYHKPDMKVGFRMNYRYDEALSFFAGINLLGSRMAKVPGLENGEDAVALKAVYDFNLGAQYRLNSRWNFFGELNNVIASRYNRWYGYPSFGINGRVGVGYSF